MDKFFYKKIFICLGFIFCLAFVFIFGCSNVNLTKDSTLYISEYRKNLFVGKSGNVLATYTTGERELDYIMDGNKTNLTDFGVLTVTFFSPQQPSQEFVLTVNDNKYEGVLELNPYDGTYVFDTECQIDDQANIELYIKNYDQTIKLVCVSSNWCLNYKQALEIFSNHYQKQLNAHISKGVLNGEIFIKIVSNNKSLDNIYWYVLCVCRSGDMYACLIDPNTKQILQS